MTIFRFRGAIDEAERARVPAVVFARCPLCDGTAYRTALEHPEVGTIVDCEGCDLRYTRSRPRHSWAEVRQAEPGPLPEVILQKEVDQQADYDAIVKAIESLGGRGRLLELGCMTGHFLDRAQRRGFEVSGLDPDVWATRYAVENFGVDARPEFLEDAGIADDSFDVVAMFHTMEHLTDPMGTLGEIHRVLRPEGLLAVEIPIIDAAAVTVLGRYHRHYVFDHTLFMTRRTSVQMLARAGFEVVRMDLTGRHIRLGRLSDLVGRVVPPAEPVVLRLIERLHLTEKNVHVNIRDILRLYAVPVATADGTVTRKREATL